MTRSKVAAKHIDLVTRIQDDPFTTRVPRATLITVSTERGSQRTDIVDFSRRMNQR